jgi:hypothetical protein
MTVIRLLAPSSVVIEVGGAGRFRRNISRGDGVLFPQIAIISPLIKTVLWERLRDRGLDIIRAIECAALTSLDIISLSAGGYLPFPTDDCNAGGFAVFVYVNAERAGFSNVESQIGSIYFIDVTFANFLDAEVDGTFRKAHLGDVLIEVQEREGSHAAEMDRNDAGLQFSAGIFVGPEFVADGQGTIECCAAPVPLAAWLKRNRAIEIANASNTGRWVACVRSVALTGRRIRSHKGEKTGETEKQGRPELSGKSGLQHGWSPYLWSGPSEVPATGSVPNITPTW